MTTLSLSSTVARPTVRDVPLTPNSLTILQQRYLDDGTVDDLWDRVSGGNPRFRALLSGLRFMPNSPTLFNAGKSNGCTLSACFVFNVADTMLDGPCSIHATRGKAIAVAKAGGGVGYYFGDLRPRNSLIKSIHRKACGPVAVMRDYHAIHKLITQGGKRDLAQMGILPVTHPDIREFIHCKDEDPQSLSSFNISAGWDATSFTSSQDPSSTFATLWREQCQSAHAHGCPGMWFPDTVNATNPNPHLGLMLAPNPCQPGSALLLTPDGIRRLDDIGVGCTVWSGRRWTKVVRKLSTGTKPVYRYHTSAGTFTGTENHQVFSGGERVEVQHADTIDTCQGPRYRNPNAAAPALADTPVLHDAQAVVDGWVLGDGMVHRASNNLVLLCLGRWDNVFHENFPAYVVRHRPGIKDTAWEVRTSLSHQDLPRTWLRRIPESYLTSTHDVAASFLRGLYAANGSVCGRRITLKTTSHNLARDVQAMLSSLGIGSYITTNPPSKIKWHNGTFTSRISYDVNVSTDRAVWLRKIGFVHHHKERAAHNTLSNTAPAAKRTYEVTHVEYLGDMPVYDITVDAPEHSYWTSGLLVSNCGETPNRNDEPCNLGSLYLARYYDPSNRAVNWNLLEEDAHTATLFLDDILDRNVFPHPDITAAAFLTRKLGLGVMGWGELLALLGIHYDTDEAVALATKLSLFLQEVSHGASEQLAKTKGPYPGYSDKTTHAPRRNETTGSIAPTGTIAVIIGAETWSIEPHYALVNTRVTNEGIRLQEQAHLDRYDGFTPKVAHDIHWSWHVKHQAAWQRGTDLGVSKTINMPNSATVGDVSEAYRLMHSLGCKGGTIFRDGCRPEQVLRATKSSSVYTQNGTPVPARRRLPHKRTGATVKWTIGGIKGWLTVNTFDDGTPAEIFFRTKNAGSTLEGFLNSFAINFSLALQSGTPFAELLDLHRHTRYEPCGPTADPDVPTCTSIPDFVVRWIDKHYGSPSKEPVVTESGMYCPECGASARLQGACIACPNCSWSRCG